MPTVAKTADGTTTLAGSETPTAWAPARLGLLVVGIVLAIVYVILLTVQTTSTVTEKGPTGNIIKTTDTEALYPEATSSVVIGAAVLLLIVAALYNRITKITGPGGIAVEFSSIEKKQASEAVSDAVKEQPSVLKDKATSQEEITGDDAKHAARDLASRASDGTLAVLQRARDILKEAGSSPSEALKLAVDSGVPRDMAKSFVFQGRTTDAFWVSLAQGVLGT